MRHIVTNTYIVISPPFNPNHKKISKTKYLLFLFWLTGWITVGLLLSSSQLQSAPLKFPKHYQNKNVFLQYFESNLGIIWYGIYLQKRKIGYLKSSARFNEKISSGCFTIETTGIVNIPSSGKKRHLEFQTIASFSAQAPYILLNYSDKVIHDNMVSHTEFTLNSKGYLANITQGGQTSHKIADIVNYSLQDYSALQWWISLQPRVGDSITYQYLSTGKLTLESNTASIDAVHEFIADGVETIYYNVTTVGPDGIGIQEVFGQDGTAYRIFLGSLFECRLESQSQAMKIDAPAELFIQNTISIDQDLGQPEKVTFLKILLKGVSETSWPAGPGQLISNDLEQNALVVTITSQKATLAAVD
ncbi:MAG: hypothetical protein HOD92_10295, partial [Deltaproteobacteria bacterium]|nr:hypothetical protein [Deltaproteobacteria bacterium]